MSASRGITSVAPTSLALSRPAFISGSHTPATSHKQHAAAATYFATTANFAYYATAHKATWLKSGSGSSLGD